MNLLNLFAGQAQASAPERDSSDDRWFGGVQRPTASAMIVTPETALRLPVVWDCLNVLSDTIAALPLQFFERQANGVRQARDRHPLHVLLHDAFELRKQMVWDLASTGNYLAEQVTDRNGFTIDLKWMPPGETTLQKHENGVVVYRYHDENGRTRTLTESEVWHIRRPPLLEYGLVGHSPIEAGREIIGAALAVQDYGARFFANDCTPPFVLEHPGHFADTDSKKNFLNAIKRWWGGARRHSPGVLEHGIKLTRVGVDNEEAQFLETRKELGYDIARLWRMPPHKVGMLERATNNNIEHQSLEFVTDCLLPFLTLIEKSILKSLIVRDDRFFAEHNVGGLLRGDLKGRYEAYAQARQWGWLSVNDIRRLENMNPISSGDVYLQPLNMAPAGSTATRPDAQITDASGRVLSRLYQGAWTRSGADENPVSFQNVINIEDHRRAA